MIFERILKAPHQTFFLFGPRGTGKSTWLKKNFKADLTFDLLKSEVYLELSANPEKLRSYVEALPKKSKIVIDEVQRVPALLNEVHSLIFEHQDNYQFALTGSSARKLKNNQSNLLAGRAVTRNFFSLCSSELLSEFSVSSILQFGCLPRSINLKSIEDKVDFLSSYVETYLREEIQQEAAVRNLPAYSRFLKHAAIMNGQVLNLNNISREAGVPRATLDGYFSILKDTLLGEFLEAIHLKAKIKEVSTPKFYFFDCGVVRALRQELREPLSDEKGYLLETLILNEMKAYSSYKAKGWEFFYWGVPSGNEVDFVVSQGKSKIAIEVKSSKAWRKEDSNGLELLLSEKKVQKAYGIYQGSIALKKNGIMIYPVQKFLELLWSGEIF